MDVKRSLLALLLLASRAHADATVPAEADSAPLRCSYKDARYWRDLESDAVKRAQPIAGTLPFLQASASRVLFGDRWVTKSPPSAAIVEVATGRKLVVADYVAAMAEDGGALIGLLAVDERAHELRWRDAEGRLRWSARNERYEDSASVLVEGGQVIVAAFARIATGSSLRSFDRATGRLLWTADVEQVNASHSKYFNDVTVELKDGRLLVRGIEAAGCYVQTFDLATGRRLSSGMKR